MTNSVISLADFLRNQIGDDRPYSSIRALARAGGVSDTTIRRIMDGEEPGLATLKKLSNGLNYPIEDLQKMAGILADDQQVQDDLTMFIMNAVKRLSPADKRKAKALLKQMLDEQDAGQ